MALPDVRVWGVVMEKKLAFEYRFGNLCGHCEHWSGYVCMIANKYTYFEHECDVEEPEPEKLKTAGVAQIEPAKAERAGSGPAPGDQKGEI